MSILNHDTGNLMREFTELGERLSTKFSMLETVNEQLREENKLLKSEHYKDTELKHMSEQLEAAKETLRYSFEITKDDHEAILTWQKEHEATCHNNPSMYPRGGAAGGCYTYEFTPTGIGTIGVIKCNCGEHFTFQELY